MITEKIEVEICSLLDNESKDGLSSEDFENPKIAPTQVFLKFQKHWMEAVLRWISNSNRYNFKSYSGLKCINNNNSTDQVSNAKYSICDQKLLNSIPHSCDLAQLGLYINQ